MVVTELGMVTIYDGDIGKVVREKFGRFSLDETSALIKTEVSGVSAKAEVPMVVTESGMITEVSCVL